MLRDSEIIALRRDEHYQQAIRAGLQAFVHDLLNSGQGDLKPDISALVRIAYALMKARLIRAELAKSTADLLERLLNRELQWRREPRSVQAVCEADPSYLWMRYDTPRVLALFSRCQTLFTDAAYRALVKHISSIHGDKNSRLGQLLAELEHLRETTLRSIATKGIWDQMVGLGASDFFERNRGAIERSFVQAGLRGALGNLPPPPEDLPPALPPPAADPGVDDEEGNDE